MLETLRVREEERCQFDERLTAGSDEGSSASRRHVIIRQSEQL